MVIDFNPFFNSGVVIVQQSGGEQPYRLICRGDDWAVIRADYLNNQVSGLQRDDGSYHTARGVGSEQTMASVADWTCQNAARYRYHKMTALLDECTP